MCGNGKLTKFWSFPNTFPFRKFTCTNVYLFTAMVYDSYRNYLELESFGGVDGYVTKLFRTDVHEIIKRKALTVYLNTGFKFSVGNPYLPHSGSTGPCSAEANLGQEEPTQGRHSALHGALLTQHLQ